MQRLTILGLAFLCGCFLTGRSAIDRLAEKQCAQVTSEIRRRMLDMEELAQTGTAKMDLYQAIQALRGDVGVARSKCDEDSKARAGLDAIERRIDRLEHDFILGPGSPG